MTTLRNIRRTATFTQFLTPDVKIPTIEAARTAPPELTRADRIVNGSFTWLTPQTSTSSAQKYELIAISPKALEDIGLAPGEENTQLFIDTVAGRNPTYGDEEANNIFPWAQAYAGWQFGQWAGQLGDGRAVSLFETTNPKTGKRYEWQLKGAGLTPYSRFADGKAVLRSSIREALGSEAVNALGIPTTRALSLVNLPNTEARRETRETCAVVCRFAQTWIRIGTFDLHHSKDNQKEVRKMADYCIDEVFKLPHENTPGPDDTKLTRYDRLYYSIVERNAHTAALWQAYAFMNGVLNTDNTSILGLSLDYGPFAFMDTFDANFSPNHDDGMLRYSYKNTPSVILWNLVRLGEDLGELLGAGPDLVDDETYVKDGLSKAHIPAVTERAEKIIQEGSQQFQKTFLDAYHEAMRRRLGLGTFEEQDHDNILTPLLETLQECELDYNQFFRKLGALRLFESDKVPDVDHFFPKERGYAPMYDLKKSKSKLEAFIKKYKARLAEEGSRDDEERQLRMNTVNPKFVLKNWILEEVIQAAKKDGDFTLYKQVLQMALEPFNETWGLPQELEDRLTGDVPRPSRDIQCSCSS